MRSTDRLGFASQLKHAFTRDQVVPRQVISHRLPIFVVQQPDSKAPRRVSSLDVENTAIDSQHPSTLRAVLRLAVESLSFSREIRPVRLRAPVVDHGLGTLS